MEEVGQLLKGVGRGGSCRGCRFLLWIDDFPQLLLYFEGGEGGFGSLNISSWVRWLAESHVRTGIESWNSGASSGKV